MEESGQCFGIHLFAGFKVKNLPLLKWFFWLRLPCFCSENNILFLPPSGLPGDMHGCFMSVSFGDKARQVSWAIVIRWA